MSQILLLTNNPINEYPIEKRLHQLGHEVFISKQMLEITPSEPSLVGMIEFFHSILLSETLSNAEVRLIAQSLGGYSMPLIRKSDELPEEEELNRWRQEGITDWIESRPSIEVLREKLYYADCERELLQQTLTNKRPLTFFTLNAHEIQVFELLYESYPQTVTREELCFHLWNKEKCNSTMAQLSAIVKNLRGKFARKELKGPIIETYWGKGYRLHETIYDQVYIE
jgi:Response regulators consisting of a CheY-like receiver domain and a winged-helix DNA-binding domain